MQDARSLRATEKEKINKSQEKSGELRIAIKVLMRVLLSRLLPVGGLPVVLALFINHCRLNFDLIIKCVSRATMDDEVLIMLSFCSQVR